MSEPWVKFTDEEYTALERQGLSGREIARRLGVTSGAISYRRKVLGRTLQNKGESQRKFSDQQLRELVAEGLTGREMADRLGVSRSTVSNRRKRLELAATFDPNAPRPKAKRPTPTAASRIEIEGSGIRDAPRPPSPVGDRARKIRILAGIWARTQRGETAAMRRRLEVT